MLLNSNTVFQSGKLSLLPYLPEHVVKYHEWMKDPLLQEQTASEPLSLSEEYEMQKSWKQDKEKLTFILHCKEIGEIGTSNIAVENKFGKMIGDVNLYLTVPDEPLHAEIEIMIAEREARKLGLGMLACRIMMDFAVKNLGLEKFVAKIGMDNTPSLKMFQKLGFKSESRSEVFREETLGLSAKSLGNVEYTTLLLSDE